LGPQPPPFSPMKEQLRRNRVSALQLPYLRCLPAQIRWNAIGRRARFENASKLSIIRPPPAVDPKPGVAPPPVGPMIIAYSSGHPDRRRSHARRRLFETPADVKCSRIRAMPRGFKKPSTMSAPSPPPRRCPSFDPRPPNGPRRIAPCPSVRLRFSPVSVLGRSRLQSRKTGRRKRPVGVFRGISMICTSRNPAAHPIPAPGRRPGDPGTRPSWSNGAKNDVASPSSVSAGTTPCSFSHQQTPTVASVEILPPRIIRHGPGWCKGIERISSATSARGRQRPGHSLLGWRRHRIAKTQLSGVERPRSVPRPRKAWAPV